MTQLFGTSEQYWEASQIALTFAMNENIGAVSYTGHSLGGGLASAMAQKIRGKAVTFNAAGISDATRRKLGLHSGGNEITAYVVSGEAVHAAQSKLGLKAEGNIRILPATYPIDDPYSTDDDIIRAAERVNNHLMKTVIVKFKQLNN